MNSPRQAAVTTAKKEVEPQLFAFCTQCNNILHPEARQCIWCGSTDIEELTLLEVASRLRSVIFDEAEDEEMETET